MAEGEGSGQGSERPSGRTSVASCAPTGPPCSHRRELGGRGRSFFPSLVPRCVNPYPPFSVAVEPFSCDSLPSVSLSQDLPSVWMCVSPQQASSRGGKVDPAAPVCPALLGPPSQVFSGFSISVSPLLFSLSLTPQFPVCGPPRSLCVSLELPGRSPLLVSIPHSHRPFSTSGPSPLFCVSLP